MVRLLFVWTNRLSRPRFFSRLAEEYMVDGKVVILSGVRTPIGSFKGSLSKKTAVELGSIVIQQAIKAATIEPSAIGSVYMGHLIQAGSEQNPARQASLLGGCLNTTDATTVNKACSSSLKAVTLATQDILTNNHKLVLAGGMESMSNAPFLVSREAPSYGGAKMEDSIIKDALTCPFNHSHMGELCEASAKKHNISRFEQDSYARMSYERAIEATKAGFFKDEIVYVPIQTGKTSEITKFLDDEELKKFDPAKMEKLKPCFVSDGTITAANSSKISDGASALVLGSLEESTRLALKPIAKIISYADAACEPENFAEAPILAIKKALDIAGIAIEDVSMFEINEAFSVVPLICIKELNIDSSKVNIHGGAVALGHPVGASGARILTHLIHVLQPHQVGVAAICNGGGGATAIVVVKCTL